MPETGVKEGGDCGQFFSRQSAVSSLQSTVSSRQSAVFSRQSAVDSQQSSVFSKESESPEVRKNLAESR